MANTFFKPFAEADRTSSRTLLHEVIPITGTIVSGTYANHNNVKSFSHGMFKSVYDYPFLSSSANHIFDVTFGYHASSSFSGSTSIQHNKKLNIYSQMAQVLSGFDVNSKIKRFDRDGNFSTTGDKYDEAWFLTFSRLLVKDEIKKGSFSMSLATSTYGDTNDSAVITLTDTGAETNYKINSPAGEYGLLKFTDVAASAVMTVSGNPDTNQTFTLTDAASTAVVFKFDRTTAATTNTSAAATTIGLDGVLSNNANIAARIQAAIAGTSLAVTAVQSNANVTITQNTGGTAGNTALDVSSVDGLSVPDNIFKNGRGGTGAGLIYYQAGVAVLTGSIFGDQDTVVLSGSTTTSRDLRNMATGSTIGAMSDAFLHRLTNIQFNNTTELNSTIYFCRANHNEFNYSSNPTYLSGSKLVVKGNNRLAPPRSYATTVGLYSADNELLAVAKLSEPLRKDPTNELTLRVRLDY